MAGTSFCLIDNPPEILDKIVSHIDRPSHLLHLALTSRAMYQLIIPEHIEFRVIRSKSDCTFLWEKMAAFPARTSNIVLEIVRGMRVYYRIANRYPPRSDVILPTKLIESQGLLGMLAAGTSPTQSLPRASDSFLTALESMSGLTRFHWSYTPCPIAVLSGLQKCCPNIREVEVTIENRNAESDSALSESSVRSMNGLLHSLTIILIISSRIDSWGYHS